MARSTDWLEEHVRRAANGDRHAWCEIVAEFEDMMWALTRAYRLSHADGADVVQTTWLRLAENVGRLREPARLRGWLATTARRECLRTLRASARELPDAETPEVSDPNAGPHDRALLRAERDAALRSAFGRLPARDQALLRMLVADTPPSYAQIGRTLEMPVGSIGPTRGRALARLRGELERRDPSMGVVA